MPLFLKFVKSQARGTGPLALCGWAEGSNLKSVAGKVIKYRIEAGFGFTKGEGTLSNGGVLQSQGFGDMCSGCAFIQEDTVITMTVEWNEKTESIKLVKE